MGRPEHSGWRAAALAPDARFQSSMINNKKMFLENFWACSPLAYQAMWRDNTGLYSDTGQGPSPWTWIGYPQWTPGTQRG